MEIKQECSDKGSERRRDGNRQIKRKVGVNGCVCVHACGLDCVNVYVCVGVGHHVLCVCL